MNIQYRYVNTKDYNGFNQDYPYAMIVTLLHGKVPILITVGVARTQKFAVEWLAQCKAVFDNASIGQLMSNEWLDKVVPPDHFDLPTTH